MPAIETAFTALRIEGGLLPPEFLQRIAALDALGQSPADYAIPPGRTVRDEIGRYWTIAEALWKDYRQNRARTDIPAERTGVERWLLRLLRDVLGYVDITTNSGPTVIGDRSFPITHRAYGGAVPLLLMTAEVDLDRSRKGLGSERHRAPHAVLQELLNANPASLWGILSNGPRFRLLRDNPSLTRPAYVEADLERIFEEGLYADFAAFWLVAHASRLTPGPQGVAGSRIEAWRAEGAKTGQRALDRLRVGVTTALRELGCGFVEHAENEKLRTALRDGTLTADALHQQLLRLVYRLLFLFAAEERDLLHPPEADPASRDLYADGYSLSRLRDRARLRRHYERYGDLWAGLSITFRGLARGTPPLGLPALGGLFDPDQCPALDSAALSNARLLAAVHALAFFQSDGSLQRVNYRDMGTEELGSVYESLLELHPVVHVATRPWTFGFVGDENGAATKGHERKLSGSYYTPDVLVQELLRSALDPVIEAAIRDNPTDPRNALLRLKVLDPTCGSGHFLLGAARRLADAAARLDSEGDLPDEALRRHALREIVRRCIFGVDRNPLAVELCKTALWIETIEPGKPLTFLDAHIRCGDSLIGVEDLSVLKSGIPDEAFKALTGDDKSYVRDLRARNKTERENPDLSLLPEVSLPRDLAVIINALTEAPEDTLEAVDAKRARLREVQSGRLGFSLRVACDLWCAANFASKAAPPEYRGRDLVPTTDAIWRYLRSPSTVYGPMIGASSELAARLRFFHWPLEFPEALAAGGFDCIVGNPPWERIKLQEQEFFASRSPAIATASNAAARRRLIAALAFGDAADRALHEAFENAKRDTEAASQFIRGCGRFPLTAVGDVNTYALFAETFLRLHRSKGRAGMIVPTGIATDDSTKAFFGEIATTGRLASLLSFENEEFIFPSVHHAYKFSLMTLVGRSSHATPRFLFFARQVHHLTDPRRAFTLSAEEIRLINPNTRTCAVFRTSADAELTKRIYARVPVLVDEAKGLAGNPWGISFMAMLHMANDSHLFRTAQQLAEAGAQRDGANWAMLDSAEMVPLYEAKMIHHFDHRWATYEADGESSRDMTPAEKSDPARFAEPRYWVPKVEVDERIVDLPSSLKAAWRLRDGHLAKEALLVWLAGWQLSEANSDIAESALDQISISRNVMSGSVMSGVIDRIGLENAARMMQRDFPLRAEDRRIITHNAGDALKAVELLFVERRRRWLMGWRDICRSTDSRTLIGSAIPASGVGDKFLLYFSPRAPQKLAALMASINSLIMDFIARQKLGGTSLKYYVFKQLPVLPPTTYTDALLAFLLPRILELTYTAHDMRAWAKDLGYEGTPFGWDENRRAHVRAELDAIYAHLYGLTRDELRYILDPADIYGPDFPSETFRVLKVREIKQYGEYRTARLVLAAWDRLTADGTFRAWEAG